MGLGGATRKLQKVADMGEELYSRINELREQLLDVRETVDETNRRVAAVENKLDGQAAILEAIAEKEGIDTDEVLTEVAIEEAEAASKKDPTDAAGETIPDAEAGADVGAEPKTSTDTATDAGADDSDSDADPN
jgi:DNA anti-recombination protein RmuC